MAVGTFPRVSWRASDRSRRIASFIVAPPCAGATMPRAGGHRQDGESRGLTKMTLYAEHGVPYYWIADPESRSVEAYMLTGSAYALAGRVTSELAALPPFSDLMVDPAAIWS